MVQESNIEWCTHTSNPVKYRDAPGRVVWGCVKVSAGCANCYAEALATRYRRGGPFTKPAMAKLTPFVDENELRQLLNPSKLPAGSKCFVGDMTDVFGEWVTDEMLDRLFAVFALRPDVVFQVLTKRPERLREYLTAEWVGFRQRMEMSDLSGAAVVEASYPLPNVWLGTSVEDQRAADTRIPELLASLAAVRFLSCEPLLGPVNLDPVFPGTAHSADWLAELDWVIVGGESGPGARPMDLEWMRSVVKQCLTTGVPVFVKQLGSKPETRWSNGDLCDRLLLRDRKGGDPSEWPEDLRVREFPEVARG